MTTNPLPAVPDTFTTMLGQVINSADDTWIIQLYPTLKACNRIHWLLLAEHFSPDILDAIKLYIIQALRQRKPNTAVSHYASFKHFGCWLKVNKFTHHPLAWPSFDEELFLDYLCHCYQTINTTSKVASTLRLFYQWGANNFYAGFNYNTYLQIEQPIVKARTKGEATRFRHPTKGPFTDDERRQIIQALAAERGTPLHRAIVGILLETGVRPVAIVLLQNQHLQRLNKEIDIHYLLTITEVKQPGSTPTTDIYKLSNQLGQLLESLRLQDAPPEGLLLPQLNTTWPDTTINSYLRNWAKDTDLLARDGETPLHLFSYRFRRDKGTTAVAKGANLLETAQILGHRNADSSLVYIETSPTFADQSEHALTTITGDLFQTFRGRITTKNEEQTQALPETPPLPLTCQPTSVCGLGKCARDIARGDLCQLDGALACFTCRHFIAFADALPQFESALHDLEQAFPQTPALDTSPQPESWLTETHIAITEIIHHIKKQQDHEPDYTLPTSRKRSHRKSTTPVSA